MDILAIHKDLLNYSHNDIKLMARYYNLQDVPIKDLYWLVAIKNSTVKAPLLGGAPTYESLAKNLSVREVLNLTETDTKAGQYLNLMLQNAKADFSDIYAAYKAGKENVARALSKNPETGVIPMSLNIREKRDIINVLNYYTPSVIQDEYKLVRTIKSLITFAGRLPRRNDRVRVIKKIIQLLGINIWYLMENNEFCKAVIGQIDNWSQDAEELKEFLKDYEYIKKLCKR